MIQDTYVHLDHIVRTLDYNYILERDWRKYPSYHVGIEYTDSPFKIDKDRHYTFAHELKYVHEWQNLYYALHRNNEMIKSLSVIHVLKA